MNIPEGPSEGSGGDVSGDTMVWRSKSWREIERQISRDSRLRETHVRTTEQILLGAEMNVSRSRIFRY